MRIIVDYEGSFGSKESKLNQIFQISINGSWIASCGSFDQEEEIWFANLGDALRFDFFDQFGTSGIACFSHDKNMCARNI